MNSRKGKLKKWLWSLGILAGILILAVLSLSLSPQGTVRLRALVDGHPMVALTCRPYHDKDESRYINATVYDISTKDQYLSVDGSFYVNMYRIHHATFLYFATAQPDILK